MMYGEKNGLKGEGEKEDRGKKKQEEQEERRAGKER